MLQKAVLLLMSKEDNEILVKRNLFYRWNENIVNNIGHFVTVNTLLK